MDVEMYRPGALPDAWNYVKKSWRTGCRQITLWSYFVIVIILGGAVGLWETLLVINMGWKFSSILLSLNTIAPPIAAAACVDLCCAKDEKYLRALAGVFIVVIGLLNFLSFLCKNHSVLPYVLASFSLIFTYVLWWLVNANNSNLWDYADASAAAGGNPGSQGLPGSGKLKK